MSNKPEALIESHKDAARRVSTYLQKTQDIKLKPTVSYEIVAQVYGASNWQTLLALANKGQTPRTQNLTSKEPVSLSPPLHGTRGNQGSN